MTPQPEALRLAEIADYRDYPADRLIAAELRRLHATVATREDEIQTHSAAVYECTRLLAQVREQRGALLEALRLIEHATAPTHDDGAYHEAAHDIACAAIESVEGEKP